MVGEERLFWLDLMVAAATQFCFTMNTEFTQETIILW